MSVLVTHPGRQHSHQAALGLHRAALLEGYWSGAPSVAEHGRFIPRRLRERLLRYAPIGIPARLTRWAPWTPALRRASDPLPRSFAAWVDFAACRAFDAWVARGIARCEAVAVLACEISALDTFVAARRRGCMALLDAPSFHHAAQDRLHGHTDPAALHRRITAIKDREIALADHILTVSELARATYLDAGVPAGKVHAVGLGADLELFRLRDPDAVPSGRFRFLFCGATLFRKGYDVLARAFQVACGRGLDAELRVVGARGDAAAESNRVPPDRICVLGPVRQSELSVELSSADCLVLPSRNDSFGMVVAEALACGVPVIVSEQVGAADLVEHGRNGFRVPAGDVATLADLLLDCAAKRVELRAMAPACRRSAESASWGAYHARLVELVSRLQGARA